jgi:glutamate carboxypeptidase
MQIFHCLEKNFNRYLSSFEAMVGINSHTLNREGVNQLGLYTSDLFESLGFTPERIPSVNPQYGNHCVFTRKGSSRKTILLISHLDTVFPADEEKINNFKWRIDGDKIYGPGTSDIKGGTVMIAMICDAMISAMPEMVDSVTFKVMLDASEETESRDFGELCVQHAGEYPIAGLIFEAGGENSDKLSIVTSRKGRAAFRISARGRSAHSGSDHSYGVNAIQQLAYALMKTEGITDYKNGVTLNIGTVHGGSAINRVPDEAFAEGEIRAWDPDRLDAAIKKLKSINGLSDISSADGLFKSTASVDDIRIVPVWPENTGSQKLLEIYMRAGKKFGVSIYGSGRGGLSDGNYIWKKIPVLDGLGPFGRHSHCSLSSSKNSKEQEYVLKSSFIPKALLNIAAIEDMIRNSSF